jgi:hypothetical protein
VVDQFISFDPQNRGYFLGRSVVIHNNNGTRIACAKYGQLVSRLIQVLRIRLKLLLVLVEARLTLPQLVLLQLVALVQMGVQAVGQTLQ